MLMKRVSVGSLRTLRSRFRRTIKEAHAPDKALFLDMLDTEKQAGRKLNYRECKNRQEGRVADIAWQRHLCYLCENQIILV